MKRFFLLSTVIATALFWAVAGSGYGQEAAGDDPGFQIVVHKSNPLDTLTRSQVSSYLLKKKVRWPNGTGVDPVDLDGRSPVRAAMSQAIHQRSVASIKNYWQRQIFAGYNTPPPELADDANVLTFIAGNPGAIGYISDETDLKDSEAKKVQITTE